MVKKSEWFWETTYLGSIDATYAPNFSSCFRSSDGSHFIGPRARCDSHFTSSGFGSTLRDGEKGGGGGSGRREGSGRVDIVCCARSMQCSGIGSQWAGRTRTEQ